ncbi:hypothetical protein D9M72_639910 [compost metagenome]
MVARVICWAGSFDSVAAMVTISEPMKENMVVSSAASTAPQPLGRKPSLAYRWLMPPACGFSEKPKIAAQPRKMKAMIEQTLISASQNSNSP